MTECIPSIHESINAKLLSTQELCDTFIVNEKFGELASTNNTLLRGPRGSGKTTLMRMLDIKALTIWKGTDANYYRNNIDFCGVFIPTDRIWNEQYRNAKGKLDSQYYQNLLQASFTYHVLARIADTLLFRSSTETKSSSTFLTIELNKEHEIELVKTLAELWCLSPTIPSIRGLIAEITFKKDRVSSDIFDAISGSSNAQKMSLPNQKLVSIIENSVKIINLYTDNTDLRWALLFDELELAPEEVLTPLMDYMRGGDENIIFKLALSPYIKDINLRYDESSSMTNQDRNVVTLYSYKREPYDFSKKLCESILRKNDLHNDIESYFKSPESLKLVNEIALFESLSKKDNTFKEYVAQQSIKFEHLNPGGKSRAPNNGKRNSIRKFKPIAYIRNEKFNEEGKLKSLNRAINYYGGFSNICAELENNPRMLKSIMGKFIEVIRSKGEVEIGEQILHVNKLFRSYKALTSTIVIDKNQYNFNTVNDLIEILSTHASQYIIGQQFYAEPSTSFEIDKEVDSSLIAAIGSAINAGALLLKEDNDLDPASKTLIGKTIRLSFLYAPEYSLPLQSYDSEKLSNVLTGNKQNNKTSEAPTQHQLF